jgi:hypothetical protein
VDDPPVERSIRDEYRCLRRYRSITRTEVAGREEERDQPRYTGLSILPIPLFFSRSQVQLGVAGKKTDLLKWQQELE